MNGRPDPAPRAGRRWHASLPVRLLLPMLLLAASSSAFATGERVAFPLRLVDPLTGGELQVESSGGVLHLVSFATWCPPCLDELPRLAELEARWAGRGYRLVLVAVPSRQTRERLAQFVRRQSPPGRLGFDSAGEVQRALGIDELPSHLLIAADGRVILRSASLSRELEQELAGALSPGRR